ncbi:MAG: RING finger protein [Planctomycetota bacterium]
MEVALVALIVIPIYIAMIAGGLSLTYTPNIQDDQRFEGFAKLLDGPPERLPLTWRELLTGLRGRVEGTIQGRRARLALGGALRYSLRLNHDPGPRRMTRQDLVDQAQGKQAAELRGALDHLFGTLGFGELRVEDGWLVVERPATEYALKAVSLGPVFTHLASLAPLLETRELVLKLGGARGRGWTAGGAQIHCPYCRDAIPEDAPDLAACEHCHTVHHRDCLEEAGGCTVLGCAGRPRARMGA